MSTDRRYTLAVAVRRAATEIIESFWDASDERLERLYSNLADGRLTVEWVLKHPDDLSAIAERERCECGSLPTGRGTRKHEKGCAFA